MPAKKERGVLARLRRFTGTKAKKAKKPVPPKKQPKSYPAGGYTNPQPRRKRMENIFDFGLKRKK